MFGCAPWWACLLCVFGVYAAGLFIVRAIDRARNARRGRDDEMRRLRDRVDECVSKLSLVRHGSGRHEWAASDADMRELGKNLIDNHITPLADALGLERVASECTKPVYRKKAKKGGSK